MLEHAKIRAVTTGKQRDTFDREKRGIDVSSSQTRSLSRASVMLDERPYQLLDVDACGFSVLVPADAVRLKNPGLSGDYGVMNFCYTPEQIGATSYARLCHRLGIDFVECVRTRKNVVRDVIVNGSSGNRKFPQ